MPRCLTVTPHLSVDDLAHRYRACRDPVERSHWHIVWLVAQGHSGAAVAHSTALGDGDTAANRQVAGGYQGFSDTLWVFCRGAAPRRLTPGA